MGPLLGDRVHDRSRLIIRRGSDLCPSWPVALLLRLAKDPASNTSRPITKAVAAVRSDALNFQLDISLTPELSHSTPGSFLDVALL